MVAGLTLGLALGVLLARRLPPPPPCLTRVVDGDTLRVRYRPSRPLEESVRLLCVDTPERGEPGYAEARTALEGMVRGKRIRLEFEHLGAPGRGRGTVPGSAGAPSRCRATSPDAEGVRDHYGRLLAYVVADGVNVNVELVRGGWSRYERGYGEGSHAAAFRRAEQEAKQNSRGVWGER